MDIKYIDREIVGRPFHSNVVLDNIYRRRGVYDYEQLNYSMKNLIPPDSLKGIDEAVELLFECLEKDTRIMVVADYDCDGATSCAVAVEGLRMLGFTHVKFVVPDRFTMGYGLSPVVVKEIEPHNPELVVTVDNGISAFEGCEAVKNLPNKPKLLITDHHLGGDTNPIADAIVNPNQVGCPFPSKALAGCGVIFYVLMKFKSHLKNMDWFNKNNKIEPDLRQLIDLVSLGTVADVVPLDYNNRILIWHGINRIRKGDFRIGIQALSDISKVDTSKISSTDFGFALGPRINSAGRLEDMTIGINCLLSNDYNKALKYAKELEDLNTKRKGLTADISYDAYNQLDLPEVTDSYGLCVYGDDFNEGVIGIVASRLKDRYHRPVIVFTKAEDGSYKGSGRSVGGVHLRDVLVNVDRESEGKIMLKYGGHAMAAGMGVRPEKFEEFKELFDKEVRKTLDKIEPIIETDGILDPNYLNIDTAILIENSGPWGQHFPKPIFRGDFKIVERRVLKGKHLKMTLKPLYDNIQIQAIAFNVVDNDDVLYPEGTIIRMAYELSVNSYNGRTNLQLMVKHFSAINEFKE